MSTRRRLLAGVGTAAVGALAGCVGSLSLGSSESTTDRPRTDATTADDPTVTVSDSYDGLTVETLSTGGSPGGVVPVRPSRVTLLDFFATWCPPCKEQIGELRAVDRSFPDVHMLSITSESDRGAVRSFWRDHDGTWPVGVDDDLAVVGEFGVERIPTTVVLDASGQTQWRHTGLTDASTIGEQLRAAGADAG